MLEYHCQPHDHISDSAKNVCRIAILCRESVILVSRDRKVKVLPGMTVDHVIKEIEQSMPEKPSAVKASEFEKGEKVLCNSSSAEYPKWIDGIYDEPAGIVGFHIVHTGKATLMFHRQSIKKTK